MNYTLYVPLIIIILLLIAIAVHEYRTKRAKRERENIKYKPINPKTRLEGKMITSGLTDYASFSLQRLRNNEWRTVANIIYEPSQIPQVSYILDDLLKKEKKVHEQLLQVLITQYKSTHLFRQADDQVQEELCQPYRTLWETDDHNYSFYLDQIKPPTDVY